MDDDDRSKLAKKIFQCVSCARQPMTISELEEAVTISAGQTIWMEPSIKLRLPTLSKLCGNLITFDESEGVISLAHHTVLLFLQSCSNIPSIVSFHFQPGEAERYLGEVCITYLNFADFEKSLATTSDTRNLQHLNRHPVGLVAQILPGFKKLPIGLWNRSDRLRHPLGFNVENNLRAMLTKRFVIDPRFQLLKYCTVNWYHHCLHYVPDDRRTFSSLQKLVLAKQLPFNWRPWASPDELDPYPHWSMFNWAVRETHRPILHIWKESVSDNEAAGYWTQLWSKEGDRLFSNACSSSNVELTNILLENRITLQARTEPSKERILAAIVDASSFGQIKIINRLLEEKTEINTRWKGKTALQAAAGVGHLTVVERLLLENANVNTAATGHSGRTALQAAAEGGHMAVVERLRAAGAE